MTTWAAFAVAAGYVALGASAGMAQTPESDSSPLAELGLPVFEITLTDEGFTAPSEVEAGLQYVTFENQAEYYADAQFIQLPEGMTIEDLNDVPEDGSIPAWFYEITFAGGADADAGEQADVVVNLAPGTWWVYSLESGLPPAEVTVAGDADAADSSAIPTDLQVEIGPYVFDFPDELPAGPQIWEVTNTHEVPHHIVILSSPEPVTTEQVQAALESEMTGTPAPNALDFSLLHDAGYVTILSQGQTMWDDISLAPGHYVALCFVPDEGQMVPHAAMGMIDVFTVTGE